MKTSGTPARVLLAALLVGGLLSASGTAAAEADASSGGLEVLVHGAVGAFPPDPSRPAKSGWQSVDLRDPIMGVQPTQLDPAGQHLLSSDGRWLSSVRRTSTGWSVLVTDRHERTTRALGELAGQFMAVAWKTDSSSVVVVHETDGGARTAAFSPYDGSRVDGALPVSRLTDLSAGFGVFGDGSLVLSQDGDLVRTDAAGRARTTLAASTGGEITSFDVWGTRVAYLLRRAGADAPDLWVVDVERGSPQRWRQRVSGRVELLPGGGSVLVSTVEPYTRPGGASVDTLMRVAEDGTVQRDRWYLNAEASTSARPTGMSSAGAAVPFEQPVRPPAPRLVSAVQRSAAALTLTLGGLSADVTGVMVRYMGGGVEHAPQTVAEGVLGVLAAGPSSVLTMPLHRDAAGMPLHLTAFVKRDGIWSRASDVVTTTTRAPVTVHPLHVRNTVSKGAELELTVQLIARQPVSRLVELWARPKGTRDFKRIRVLRTTPAGRPGQATTQSPGAATTRIAPTIDTQLQWRFAGDPVGAPSALHPSSSAVFTVNVTAAAAARVLPLGMPLTYNGTSSSRRPVHLQVKDVGGWRTVRTATPDRAGVWRLVYRPPHRGQYTVRVYYPPAAALPAEVHPATVYVIR